ncbi:hypothetical protein NQZ79_g353 [Umbelopsis isabellina]|nr:hypothetical protein NQZ79_g353 [Umbelopsis isabellina]
MPQFFWHVVCSSMTSKNPVPLNFDESFSENIVMPESRHEVLSNLLNTAHSSQTEIEASLDRLRLYILEHHLDNSTQKYRPKIWKALLEVYYVSASCYIDLCQAGPSCAKDDVENDTVSATADEDNEVNSSSITKSQRILNAFVRLHTDKSRLTSTETVFKSKLLWKHQPKYWQFSYVQSMSCLVLPFVNVMSELDAFFSFTTFVRHCCPLYVQPNCIGARCGAKLLEACLKILDPELLGYLHGKGLDAEEYAHQDISTFSASALPFSETLHLWDIMLAFGFHLNIVFIVARLVRRRKKILCSTSPYHLLRAWPPLDAETVISDSFYMVKRLPESLYLQLVRHTFDESVSHEFIVDSVMHGTESNELPDTTAALLRRMAGELVCPIWDHSLSYYTEPMSTPCLHTYCKACIVQSLESLAKCPLCKIHLTKRQLNPMPAIAEIVNAFEEMREAYEDVTGQALSQEPIRSSQWQMHPDPNLTQKYPYPNKYHDETTSTDGTQRKMTEVDDEETTNCTIPLHSNQTAAALRDQSQMVQPSMITDDRTDELQCELSRLSAISQVEEEIIDVDFDDDMTQIPSSQVEYNSGASSPDLSYPLSMPLPAQSTTSFNIPDTYQSTQFSADIGANPSPDFWHDNLREQVVLSEKVYVILGTHLSHSILSSESRKAVEQLNGTLVDKFTPEVTHVVTSVDENGHARRTLKYLQSIVSGKWILNETWLEKSILAGRFVPEEEYEVLGDEASDRPSVPSLARQMVQRKKMLFANMKIILSGSFHGPSREDLAGLIRFGGGQIIENTTDPASEVVIVLDPRSNEARHYDKNVNTVITAARILDCISCYTFLLN